MNKKEILKFIGNGAGTLVGMFISAICGKEFENAAPRVLKGMQQIIKIKK